MEWRETKTTGGFLTSKPMVFTKDSKYMFSCCGSVVKMFSVTTGEQMRFLKGHTDKVIGVAINPLNQFQLFSFSLDGTVKVWDYNDAVLVKSFNLLFPIIDFAFDPKEPKLYLVTTLKKFVRYDERKANYTKQKNAFFSAMRTATAKGLPLPLYEDYFTGKIEKVMSDEFIERTVFRVYCWNYLTDPPVKAGLKSVCRPKSCKSFMVTPDGRHFVIRTGKSITIWDTKTQSFSNFKNSSRISSIALHPKQDFIATGDELGQIKLWYCFVNDPEDEKTKMIKQDPKSVVLHWHSQHVSALSFDAEGHYMFSGGREMVFVIWQLGTQKKDFIPRIGAPLIGIHTTPDHSIYAVSCANNTIKLISTRSRNLLVSIEGIKYEGEYLRTGLVREPNSNQLVFNGSGGHLQFFEVYEDRHVAHMEITPPNLVRSYGSKNINDPYVSDVVFSTNGQWMVTVDFRPETKEQSIKFWLHDTKRQQYYLNSQVNNPHEQKVSFLAYNPASDMCVTTSWDGKFKIWGVRDRSEVPAATDKGPRHTKEWYCRSVGFYRNNRDGSRMPCRACSFSQDGSLLAIAFDSIITLWSPQTTTLLNTLVYPATFEYIKELYFLPSSTYLVAITTDRLFVWELLSMSLWYSYAIQADLFAVHPTKPKFVVVSKGFVEEDSEKGYDKHDQNRMFLFEGALPKPVTVLTINTPMKGIGFVPNKADKASSSKSKLMGDPCSIIYLTGNQEFKFVRELSREDYEARLRSIQTEADNYQLTLNKKPLAEGDTIFKQLYGDEEIDDYLRRKAMFQTPAPSSDLAPVAAASARKDPNDYSDLMMVGDEDPMMVDTPPATKPAVGLPVVFSAAAHSKLSNFFEGPSHTIPTPTIVYNKFVERLLPKKENHDMNGVEDSHLDKSGEDYDNQNYNRELDVDLALDFEQSMNKLLAKINEPKLIEQEISVSSTAKFTLPQYDFLGGDFFENPVFKQAPAASANTDTPAKGASSKKKGSATPAKKSSKKAEKEEENNDNNTKKNTKHEYDSLAMDQDDETTSTPKAKSRRKSTDGAGTPAKSNTNTPKSSTPKSKTATPVPDSGKRSSKKRKQSEMSPDGK